MAVPDVVTRHAPLVVLHRDDKLRPSAPERFIARSRLRWASGRGLDGEQIPAGEKTVDARRLGAASERPYKSGSHLASALTRPLDESSSRAAGLALEQGFFLGLKDEDDARGDPSTSSDRSVYAGTPIVYDHDRRAKAITYWLFYPGSTPPLGLLRPLEQLGIRATRSAGRRDTAPPELEAAEAAAILEEFERAYPSLATEGAGDVERTRGVRDVVQRLKTVSEGIRALLREDDVLHEGDWERITVYLDLKAPEKADPASVGYYRHATHTFLPWSEVETSDGTHPVAYCAIGSHASLPSPDYGHIDVGDGDGPRWSTWKEGLRPVQDEPWFGFGGAWGRVGRVRDTTGPLGPGAHWKHAAPRPAVTR
jgi:hypothetical protein